MNVRPNSFICWTTVWDTLGLWRGSAYGDENDPDPRERDEFETAKTDLIATIAWRLGAEVDYDRTPLPEGPVEFSGTLRADSGAILLDSVGHMFVLELREV